MDFTTAVKITGIFVIFLGIILCLLVSRTALYSPLYKRLAPLTFLVAPLIVVCLGNYHVFEGSQEVGSCIRCHVMAPIANDMMDPQSTTLAARHYKNGWIATKQCFTCHKDYGLNGTIKAKMDGFRHLVKYTLRTYKEPIRFAGRFNNQNCLYCHSGTPNFEAIKSHHTLRERLEVSRTNCTHCHGFPHPTPLERTPGTARYEALMNGSTAQERSRQQ
ncbi:MAG: hypothetical protein ACE5HN_03175 [Nitrospiria bacterium]